MAGRVTSVGAAPNTLVELCAGSAALTLFLFLQKPPVAYAGNKTEYAEQIWRLKKIGRPKQILLVDAGPWANTLECLRAHKQQVITHLTAAAEMQAAFARKWAEEMYTSKNPSIAAAAHLLMIASSVGQIETGKYRGGLVGGRIVDGFVPNRRLLLQRVWNFRMPDNVTVFHNRAQSIPPRDATVYIDPPYHNGTQYGATFSRDEVVRVAREWDKIGARVIVSEAEAIPELVAAGWTATQLRAPSVPFRKKKTGSDEWITCNF